MKLQAILHIPKSSAYAYPLAPKKFHVRLRTAKDDVEQAWLVIGNQYLWKTRERFPMEKTGSDALFDYFEATYCCEDTRLGYYFEISSGEECLVYAESGFHNPHTVNIDGERTEFLHFQFPYIHAQEVHQPPEWVRSAAFYQIFPERFWNGDPALSPEGTEPWGTPPTRSNFLGGDLKGVVQKLDHLTELGANAIYLTPIFEASSNHKYDTIDYTRIDPHFGDESTLVELVQQAHRRGIRIMLDGVFNHCGFYFRQFQDVLRHGEASPYKDWFHIHSFPVTLDPPNFDGFGIGPGMPKLNTQNPEVKEYLLGAVAKWTRTGIDGWRLDVSDEVDSDFWREFRRTVKDINPEAVIIGENWWDAEPWLRGDQFDGVMNYEVQRACVLYFAQRKIHPPGAAGASDARLDAQYGSGQLLHAEPFGQPRHAPVPHRVRGRYKQADRGGGLPILLSRDALHLLWHRDWHDRDNGPGLPRRLRLGPGALGPAPVPDVSKTDPGPSPVGGAAKGHAPVLFPR